MKDNKKYEIEAICEECGRKAPIDFENSTSSQLAYKTDKPCKCGGRFKNALAEIKK